VTNFNELTFSIKLKQGKHQRNAAFSREITGTFPITFGMQTFSCLNNLIA